MVDAPDRDDLRDHRRSALPRRSPVGPSTPRARSRSHRYGRAASAFPAASREGRSASSSTPAPRSQSRALDGHRGSGIAAGAGDRPPRQLRQPGALRSADHASASSSRRASRGGSRSTSSTAPRRAGTRSPTRSRRPPSSPLFAYEAILNLIGMAVLLFVIRRFARVSSPAMRCSCTSCGTDRSGRCSRPTASTTGRSSALPTATWLGIIGCVAWRSPG